MINNLKRIEKNKEDNKFNINVGRIPIKSKIFMEDLGLMSKNAFSKADGKKLTKEQRSLLLKEQKRLAQIGYGKKNKQKKKKK